MAGLNRGLDPLGHGDEWLITYLSTHNDGTTFGPPEPTPFLRGPSYRFVPNHPASYEPS